jgi:hypothetical protein
MSDLASINTSMRLAAIKTLLRNHPRLLEKVVTPDGKRFNVEATPEALALDDPWDLLVCMAWDIWNGAGGAEFDRILNELPQADFEAFIAAMKDFSDLRDKIRFAYVSGMEDD